MSGDDVTKEQDHWTKQVEYWTSKRSEYQQKLRDADKHLDEARTMLSPFRVGQEVEYHKRGQWVPAIVRQIEPNSWGFYFQVSLRKKDGDWMQRTERAFGDRDLR